MADENKELRECHDCGTCPECVSRAMAYAGYHPEEDDADDDGEPCAGWPHARCVDCSEQADTTSDDGEPRCWRCDMLSFADPDDEDDEEAPGA